MGGPMGHRGPGEIVTGEDAQKAIDAALAVVPGTADHVHKDASGNCLVMVTTSDNTHPRRARRQLRLRRAEGRCPAVRAVPATVLAHPPPTNRRRRPLTRCSRSTRPPRSRVFVRDGEGYAVLMRTDNGKKKVVLLDEKYTIQSVENPRKRSPRQARTWTSRHDVTGPNFKKAEAAALEEFPGGTVMDVHKKGKKFYAMVKKADDSMVVVVMNADFEVTGKKAMDFPVVTSSRRRRRPPRDGHGRALCCIPVRGARPDQPSIWPQAAADSQP